MISRLKHNFAELIESIATKKDEVLKQNKIMYLESLFSFYKQNKELILNEKGTLFSTINECISKVDLKNNFDFSFIQKMDMTCIIELIEKVKKFYEYNCIEPIENNIRTKFIEKFKKILKYSKILYIIFTNTILNYYLNYFDKISERAPPIKFFI